MLPPKTTSRDRVLVFVTALAAFVALPPALAAQEPVPALRLTLADAMRLGAEASHRLAELSARQEAASAASAVEAASGRPQVSVRGGYTRTNHVEEFGIVQPDGVREIIYPDVPDNISSRIGADWTLFDGRRTESLVAAASLEADAIGHDRAALGSDVAVEVATAYWAVVTGRENERVVEASLTAVEAHLETARDRYGAGLVPSSDVTSAEAERASQQALLVQARTEREVAALTLRRLLGLDPNRPLELTEPVAAQLSMVPSAEELVPFALEQRPERAAIAARLTALDRRAAAATSTRVPSVVASGGYDYARPNPRIFPRAAEWNDSWDASVNVVWSLFDGGRTSAELRRTSAEAAALEQRLAELDSVIALDVRRRRLEIDAALATVTAAEEGVRSAREAVRVLAIRYRGGVATASEVLDAQTAALGADLALTRARVGVRLAEVRLDRAIGRP